MRRLRRLCKARFWMVLFALALIAAEPARARRSTGPKTSAVSAADLSQIHVLGPAQVPFALNARAAILTDAASGATLYAFNEHLKMQPASLAKIMTFLIALEAVHTGRLSLDTPVMISREAWQLSLNRSVSRMFLEVGQQVRVRDLFYGLMVSSGNDAAIALAEYLGGSQEGFVRIMNNKCGELGLTETRFATPDGLPAPDQYTTAFDIAQLARILVVRYPDALTYTGTKEFTFDKITQRNFNTLLFYDSRVDGIKTGHVQEAGYHLVATAKSGGQRLISAVMGTKSPEARRVETEKLIDWSFRTFVTMSPDWQKVMPTKLPVYGGEVNEVAIAPVTIPAVTVTRGGEKGVSLTSTLANRTYLRAPVKRGTTVGELILMVDGKPKAQIPVETLQDVPPGGLIKRAIDRVRLLM
jgi:serine-type D-Ala-D-Ala carboxypeptidase (penicillin-binding protein 5/6)